RKQLTPAALRALRSHEWRGNVRELENSIERAVILTQGDAIDASDLMLGPLRHGGSPGDQMIPDETMLDWPLNKFVDEMSRRHVLRVLDARQWRKQEAADALGVDRATLYRMIKRFGLEQDEE